MQNEDQEEVPEYTITPMTKKWNRQHTVEVYDKEKEIVSMSAKHRRHLKYGYKVGLFEITERIAELYVEDFQVVWKILCFALEVLHDAVEEGETVIIPSLCGISGTKEELLFKSIMDIIAEHSDKTTKE